MTRNKGIYFSLVAAVISGFSIFINKFAVEAIKQPLVFTSIKNIAVGMFVVAVLLSTRKWQKIKTLTKKEVFYLVLIGLIGGSLPFYLFFTGLSQVPAINAAIIQKTLVVWTALLALPFLKEKLSKLQILGILALFVGNIFVGGFKGFSFSTGELLILMATILWAVESIFAKKVLKTVDSIIVASARMGFGSALLLIAAAITAPTALAGVAVLTGLQWFLLIITAVALAAYVLSWYKAIQLAPVTVVASILVLSTLITNILSALFVTHNWQLVLSPQTFILLSGAALFLQGLREKKLVSIV